MAVGEWSKKKSSTKTPDPVTPVVVRERGNGIPPKRTLILDDDSEEDVEELMQVDVARAQESTVPNTSEPPRQMGSKARFVTTKPDGKMRDVITIECPRIYT